MELPIEADAQLSTSHERRPAIQRHMSTEPTEAVTKFVTGDDFHGCGGSWRHHRMTLWFQRLRDHTGFQVFIVITILAAGVLVGVNTYSFADSGMTAEVLSELDNIVLGVFIAEVLVKLLAEGSRPWHLFLFPWNTFDVFIVGASFANFGGGAVVALRLVRLMRVLKLVRALPKLRVLAIALLYSLSSIAYIGLLLGLLFYFYAVIGVSFFADNDPFYFGTLHNSALTLFRVATLEDWTEIMYIQMHGCNRVGYTLFPPPEDCVAPDAQPKTAIAYFVSFVILANMMVLNLFIGIISGSMAEARGLLEQELLLEQGQHVRRVNASAIQAGKLTKLHNIAKLLSLAAHGLQDIHQENSAQKADLLVTVDTALKGSLSTSHPVGMRTLSAHLTNKSMRKGSVVRSSTSSTWRSVAKTLNLPPAGSDVDEFGLEMLNTASDTGSDTHSD